MADPDQPVEDNIETHPVKLAIGVVVGAVALIVGIILLVQFAIGAYGARSLKDDPSMSPEAVAKRIAPVASVQVDPNAPAPAPAAERRSAARSRPSMRPPRANRRTTRPSRHES